MFAIAAALAFGLATPLVARFGRQLGPFSTAACLYGGAALIGATLGRAGRGTGHPLRRRDFVRLGLMAVLGATLAPTLLAFGLQHTGATAASLVLNLEAVFTLALAALVFGEPLGRQVIVAALAMLAGGTLLVLDVGDGAAAGLGLLAVAGATLAWGIDNTLSRPLADAEPLMVVMGKAAIGAILSLSLALVRGEATPPVADMLALMLVGAIGYGGSLALYLAAQRNLGAGRTGSIFALGPFVGALVAIALGDRSASCLTLGAALLFGLGVWLHLHEPHAHAHVHAALDHDHFHRHDDGHHDHAHPPSLRIPKRGHAHPHHHDALAHAHPHAPDLHHQHRH